MKKIEKNKTIYFDRISNDCILSDNKFIKVYNFLLINFFKVIDNNKADIIILDLCGVNNDFLQKTYKKIDEYLKCSKVIILFGCISNELKNKYGNKLLYINSKNYLDFENYFNYNISLKSIDSYNFKNKLTILDTDNEFKNYKIEFRNFEKKSFIEISTGCQFNCSYCNIKKIKGDTKSRSIRDIIDEIKREMNNGKEDFYLLSDDCGSYGFDIGVNFPDLLDEIFKLGEINIYITNIYPAYFLKFFDRIKKYIYENKIKLILLPLQHTSERVLKLMNRNYNINKIIDILKDIKINSNVELVNHIIFDFYDEKLAEFADTFKLLPYYNKNFYFRYSDINKIVGKNKNKNDIEKKIILLKKLQKKYNIDITL